MIEIPILLGQAYYNMGYINIPMVYNGFFGENNINIYIYFDNWNTIPVIGVINRTDNPNGSPRIRMGINYTNWVQAQYNQGDNIAVVFNHLDYPNSILIS